MISKIYKIFYCFIRSIGPPLTHRWNYDSWLCSKIVSEWQHIHEIWFGRYHSKYTQ